MKPRDCWPVLEKKAVDEVESALAAVAAVRKNIEYLQGRREQLLAMYADYKSGMEEKQQKLHSMADAANQRQFMSHLLQLVDRIDEDLKKAQSELIQAREVQRLAEHQRVKMSALVEQDLSRVKAFERKKDQREMDTLGITLFNLKT
jgi:flagellar export protein FliJ